MANIGDLVKPIFGSAYHLVRGYIPGHDGVDIGAKEGTPVYAVASGVVEYARDARVQGDKGRSGWAMGGGNVVNINVGNDMATQYAHLQRFVVSEGQRVSKGQLIGYVGRTGGTTASGAFGGPGAQFVGAHVHFGLWNHKTNKMVNPTAYLASIGSVHPGKAADDVITPALGAWNNVISFPVGHVITTADVDKMMTALDKAGYFKGDNILGGGKEATRAILNTAIGSAWDKPLQDSLSAKFGAAAVQAGDPFGIASGLAGVASTVTKVATYAIAVVLIIAGLWLYSKSTPTEVPVG